MIFGEIKSGYTVVYLFWFKKILFIILHYNSYRDWQTLSFEEKFRKSVPKKMNKNKHVEMDVHVGLN